MLRRPILFVVLAGALIAAGVWAAQNQHQHPAPKGKGAMLTCPVMSKNKVNIAQATKKKLYADYRGNRYFFCCASCPIVFKANPAKFAKAPHIKTPKRP